MIEEGMLECVQRSDWSRRSVAFICCREIERAQLKLLKASNNWARHFRDIFSKILYSWYTNMACVQTPRFNRSWDEVAFYAQIAQLKFLLVYDPKVGPNNSVVCFIDFFRKTLALSSSLSFQCWHLVTEAIGVFIEHEHLVLIKWSTVHCTVHKNTLNIC